MPRSPLLFAFALGLSLAAGCGEQEKMGIEVADALCADPAPLQLAARMLNDAQMVGQQPDKAKMTALCNAFTTSMEAKGVKLSRAKMTLGAGGKTIWEKTISPRIAKQCPTAGEPGHVGGLVSMLLACKPMGIW